MAPGGILLSVGKGCVVMRGRDVLLPKGGEARRLAGGSPLKDKFHVYFSIWKSDHRFLVLSRIRIIRAF